MFEVRLQDRLALDVITVRDRFGIYRKRTFDLLDPALVCYLSKNMHAQKTKIEFITIAI